MQIYSVPDIVGDSAAHAISSVVGSKAKTIFIGAVGGVLRVGDSAVTAARGVNVAQNATLVIAPDGSDPTAEYPLNLTYIYVPSGATATISYAQ